MGRGKRKLTIQCAICHEPFETYLYDITRRGKTYCSLKCLHIGMIKPCPDQKLLRELYDKKYSMNVIGNVFKVSDVTVKKWLLAAGEVQIRGMGEAVSIAQTGKTHSEARKKAIAEGHRRNGNHRHVSGENNPNFTHIDHWKSHRSHGGRRADLENKYFRSSWEANMVRYWNWMKEPWEYEPRTFWFEDIKRGTRAYTPDFWLPQQGYYVEVKGYMDQVSRTKLERMTRYYPHVKLIVIDPPAYRAIAKKVKRIVPNWEEG